MQAKDVPDERMLAAIAQVRGAHGPPWSALSDVRAAMPDVPPKVVLAKLRSMVKRGVVDGCACGCRGDFTVKEQLK